MTRHPGLPQDPGWAAAYSGLDCRLLGWTGLLCIVARLPIILSISLPLGYRIFLSWLSLTFASHIFPGSTW